MRRRNREMQQAINHFNIDGAAVSCERYGEGHINETYLVGCDSSKRYILQKLSRKAFPDIPGLMENIYSVTKHLSSMTDDPRAVLRLIPCEDGQSFYLDKDGEYWRVYDFVEDSICLQKPESSEDFRQSAVAFGDFQRMLSSFDASTLHETIPGFHNTPKRYSNFRRALENDSFNRAKDIQKEIDFVLSHEQEASALQNLLGEGSLPLRVTHNDTKLNNVLLDRKTRKALCVIDLDTVMPGLVSYDFGDSIRFGASTGAEDEKDLDKISLDLSLYEIFAEGFVSSCPDMTKPEIETLPLGAKIMTLECGVRFLADYLEGDVYFSTARPEHNLDRARTQFKLVSDTEKRWDDINGIIAKLL